MRCPKPNTVADLNSKYLLTSTKIVAGDATDMKRSWLWTTKIYLWQFRNFILFRCGWQAIIREDCKILIVQLKIIASWSPPDILRIALQIMLTTAVSIASCERSFNKLKLVLSYLRASMTYNNIGQVLWSTVASMRVRREETAKIYSDESIGNFASINAPKVLFELAFLSNSNRKSLDTFMFRWNCVFKHKWYMPCSKSIYCAIEIKCVPFQNKLSFAVAKFCLIFLEDTWFCSATLCRPIKYDNVIIWMFWCSS